VATAHSSSSGGIPIFVDDISPTCASCDSSQILLNDNDHQVLIMGCALGANIFFVVIEPDTELKLCHVQ